MSHFQVDLGKSEFYLSVGVVFVFSLSVIPTDAFHDVFNGITVVELNAGLLAAHKTKRLVHTLGQRDFVLQLCDAAPSLGSHHKIVGDSRGYQHQISGLQHKEHAVDFHDAISGGYVVHLELLVVVPAKHIIAWEPELARFSNADFKFAAPQNI